MSWTGLNWTDQHPRFVADLTGARRPKIIDPGNGGTWTTVGSSRSTFQPSQIVTAGLTDWRVGEQPQFFTGHGNADIGGFGNDGVWTALSNGDGTFQPPQFGSDFGGVSTGWRVDQHPRFLADLTGDGRADLVGFGDDGVWTALGNGDGTFQPPQLVSDFGGVSTGWRVDQHPRFLADLTGDGRADLVGFGDDGVWTALGNGDGTFQPPQLVSDFGGVSTGWRVDQHPRFLADLTGDGRADIVGFGDDGVWTALGNGDGTFQPPQFGSDFGGVSTGWRVDQHPRFLADLTGDGRADIVGFGDDGVWTALGNGNGTFQPPQFVIANLGVNSSWRVDQHPRFLADLTGDGRADIVGFGDDGVWTALGNGDGTFQPPRFVIANLGVNSSWRVDQHPRFLADLTGDGRADIVGFGDDGVWTALGNGNGTFQPPQLTLMDFGAHSADTAEIRHIFVLMLENRSFDHMLGFSDITGTDAVTGLPTTIKGLSGTESNDYNDEPYTVTREASYVMNHGPGHDFDAVLTQLTGGDVGYPSGGPYPPIDSSGYARDYGPGGDGDTTAEVMKCFTKEQLPVLNELAQEFVVCDNWFSSMPGATWPNRHFVHAATAGGLDENPSYADIVKWTTAPGNGFRFTNGTLYDALDRAGLAYRFYAGDSLPMAASLDGVSVLFDIEDFDDMAEDMSDDDFAAVRVIHIEPSYDVFNSFRDGSSQHPLADVRSGEAFIKATYEAIRNSPLWEHSLLIITWDEHGGFYDHEPPPVAVPPGDEASEDATNHHGFMFDQLGPRVPAIVISPLIPKNVIDHRVYDHASIVATIERIFGLSPLTDRDRNANALNTLILLARPRTDTPAVLSSPAGISARVAPPRPLSQTIASTPTRSIDQDHVAPFLWSAVAQDLEISDPSQRPAIIAKIRSIRSHAEALEYAQDVVQRVAENRTILRQGHVTSAREHARAVS